MRNKVSTTPINEIMSDLEQQELEPLKPSIEEPTYPLLELEIQAKQQDTESSWFPFKRRLLILLVLQTSSAILVGRYTRAPSIPESERYDVGHLVLTIEVTKFVLANAIECYATGGKLIKSLQEHILDKPLDALKVLVPALLFLVQSNLIYVALSNLSAPLFQVTNQGKLVTTALVSVLMLKRKYSIQQWICLCVLSMGVAIVIFGESKGGSSTRRVLVESMVVEDTTSEPEEFDLPESEQNLFLGMTAVSVACFTSALAGVYFEKILKKTPVAETSTEPPPEASLWMRNIQLSFFSIVIASSRLCIIEKKDHDFFHGFTSWVWVLVGLQAGGGLLVAAVMKYADNVLKGVATGVSVILSTALSILLFDTMVTECFVLGAAMILTSVYYFSNPVSTKQWEQVKVCLSVVLKGRSVMIGMVIFLVVAFYAALVLEWTM